MSRQGMLSATAKRRRWMAALLCVGMLLGGCSGVGPAPQPLKDLHLPGVAQVPGITTIDEGINLGIISAVAAYQAADSARSLHILFLLDGKLYDVRVDGSDLRPIPLTRPCTSSSLSVTADGKWLACEDDEGVEISSLAAQPSDSGRQILPNEDGVGLLRDPSWSPDGRHVAFVSDQGGGCSITIYTTSALFDQFDLSVVIPLPDFLASDNSSRCAISDLSWSPDGAWIALVNGRSVNRVHPPSVYAFHVAPFATIIPALGKPYITIPGANALLVSLGETGNFSAPSWSHGTDGWSVTFADYTLQTILRVNLLSGQSSQLLRVEEGEITNVSWTPGSQHLVFVQSTPPQCLECSAPTVPTPSHLYVYTPAT